MVARVRARWPELVREIAARTALGEQRRHQQTSAGQPKGTATAIASGYSGS